VGAWPFLASAGLATGVTPVAALGYAVLLVGWTACALVIVGASAVRAAPRNVVGWLLLVSGVCMPVGIAAFLYARAAFDGGHDLPIVSWAGWLDGWPWVPAQLAVALFAPLLFPDGHLPSIRWRPLVVVNLTVCATLMLSTLFDPHLLDWPNRTNPTGLPGATGELAHQVMLGIALVAPLTLAGAVGFELRARRQTDHTAMATMSQVRPAVWLLTASWWSCLLLAAAGAPTIYALPLESLGMVAVGVTCWIAIRRHGLFDARLVVRRAVVYGALTGCILVVYVLVAVALTGLGASHATAPAALVVAILVAVPLRDRLQTAANRLVFGLRDDPVASLLALGDQLERAAAIDDVLPAAARSIQQTLRLQQVTILDGDTVAAQAGALGEGDAMHIPLLYAGERVGTLIACQVDSDAPLDAERRNLLAGIARPIAAALRTIALSRDLTAAHERLVSATEEERRRLQRDLHDGLGPALSSAVLGVSRAHALLASRPDAAAAQLEQLTGLLQQAVADVRRLVYDLRPAALDQLGLVGALDEHARSLGHFQVTGPDDLPPLAAATEVAAYRIALEAMTNAVRHARASHGEVTLSLDDGLRLEVRDDGAGLPHAYQAGVGITSMRERAAQLGGTCDVRTAPTGGTVVSAWLPT
jgi:signal transduction histidine kinase